MNDLQEYHPNQAAQGPAGLEALPGTEDNSAANLIKAVLRHWRLMLLSFLLICAAGLPPIWFRIKPRYQTTGAIRVAPIMTNILSGERDSGQIQNYQMFMNTQAELITSSRVLDRVADDLAEKNLTPFAQAAEPITALRNAVAGGAIQVAPARRTELIKITVTSGNPAEAELIVNAFLGAYMAMEGSNATKRQDRDLAQLQEQRKILRQKLDSHRNVIRQMAQEYGTVTLTDRQSMMLQRVARLQAELTQIQTRKMALQAQVQLLEQTKQRALPPDSLLKMRHDFVNSDLTVGVLTTNTAQLEQTLIAAKQTLAPANPELRQRAELLEALSKRLNERQLEVAKNFDTMMTQELAKTSDKELANTKIQFQQTLAHEKRLRDMMAKQNSETIELGRKQLTIQDFQEQLELTKQLYDAVRRRIQDLEMQRKRPARVSLAYNAASIPVGSKRKQYALALMFAALACGILLALAKDKADLSLQTPNDVARRVGIKILGTTTRPDSLRKSLLPHQLADEYQTIRANLDLPDSKGIPAKLAVTSPGVREGKTTLSINLATSLAKAGKKVLLIDGDLRKPDIARLLNLPHGSRSLQELLFGSEFDSIVQSVPSIGLDVLTADSRNSNGAFELLVQPHTATILNKISEKYDHVIIDTPPVLAVADALLWAKIADAVILTSLAGYTSEANLRDAVQRLTQIRANLLGTILNSVRARYSYNRYGPGYYAQRNPSKKTAGAAFLLPTAEQDSVPDSKY